jgi:hypothetical protein
VPTGGSGPTLTHCFRVAGPPAEPSNLWRPDGGTSFEGELGTADELGRGLRSLGAGDSGGP